MHSIRRANLLGFHVRMVTDEGVRRRVNLQIDREHPQGQLEVRTGGDRVVRCADKTRKVDYVGDRVRIVIPRSCLDGRRWVRVGVSAFRLDGNPAGGEWTMWADDASKTGDVTDDIRLGERVRRG